MALFFPQNIVETGAFVRVPLSIAVHATSPLYTERAILQKSNKTSLQCDKMFDAYRYASCTARLRHGSFPGTKLNHPAFESFTKSLCGQSVDKIF